MTLKGLCKSNLPRIIFILLLYVVLAFGSTMTEYLGRFYTSALAVGNLHDFIFWILIEIGVGIVTTILSPWSTYLFTKQIQGYLDGIRDRIVRHYYGANNETVAQMQNDLGNNMQVLSDNYAAPWVQIWSNVLMIIMSVATLLVLHWSLIIATVIAGGLVMLVPKIMEKQTAKTTKAASERNAQFLDTIANWFAGLNELRRYNAFTRLNHEIDKCSHDLAQANVARQKVQAISWLFTGSGNAVAQTLLTVWSGILFFTHQIDFGSWMVASSFAYTIFNGLYGVTAAMTQINSTKKLRQDAAKLLTPVEKEKELASPASLSVKGLVVQYDHGETITYPDFTVKQGTKLLLTGDSGTGKSTLFKVLLGQIKPKQGIITYFDKNGQEVKPNFSQIGYLAQDAKLFPATIAANITMFNSKLNSKLEEVTQQFQLASDLAKFPAGTETEVDLDRANLSGGQKQKVVLARAGIHDPDLLLMDEATSAIDSKATAKIMQTVTNSQQTVLVIAHNLTPQVRQLFDEEIHLETTKKVQDDR
ncbi:ABC transporter ATP-binding protein [Lactobacillus sp. ESL0791]|uniref:ATP-binding cassette domain-containing protein n=1 Tax=Lactobacillus sp. ESL0791 TaxID=2983234 RepID=UPI0023F9B011|nr:ABC transporter ATP-binding protein [Lactobacillus sp. ESL0791]MDF7638428.1 ABC transporter ATP-binding protein [Lactobacillus sp. ESL0791]